MDTSNYNKLKEDAENYYSDIKRIFSPALKQEITFSSEGFNHIVYKNSRSERNRSDQIARFKLLPLAVKLIKLATTYQEYEETLQEFLVKQKKKRVKKSKSVRYWGVIAIIDNRKIKVILRKVGDNGKIHFWSIIPAWTTNKFRDLKFYTTMKGKPDED